MLTWHIIFPILFSATQLPRDTVARQHHQTCNKYKSVLPRGQCSQYFHKKEIALSVRQIQNRDESIKRWFDAYVELYKNYAQNRAGLKLLLRKYVNDCERNADAIDQLINKIEFPSANAVVECSRDAKEFICQVSNPICVGVEKRTSLPCHDRCVEMWKLKSCSFMLKVKPVFLKLSQLCPSWSENIDAMLKMINCENYGDIKTHHKGYCFLKEAKQLEPPKRALHHFTMLSLDNDNGGIEPTTCTNYNKVLPRGICSAYLKGKKIAQTNEIAEKADENLDKYFNMYLPLYASYRENDMILKRLISFYAARSCGENEEMSKLIDGVTLPSGDDVTKCSSDLKEFICLMSHPICMVDAARGKEVAFMPCRNKCNLAWSTPSCSGLFSLLPVIEKISKLCPALEKRLDRHLKKAKCINYPSSKRLGQSLCPSNNLGGEIYGYAGGLGSIYAAGVGYRNYKAEENFLKELIDGDKRELYNGEMIFLNGTSKRGGGALLSTPRPTHIKEVTTSTSKEELTPTKHKKKLQCVPYKKLHKSLHICDKYLDDSYVLDDKKGPNNTMYAGSRYVFNDSIIGYQKISVTAKLLTFIWSKLVAGCTNNTLIKQLKEKITQKININATRECMKKSTWFYCNVFNPKCLYSSGNHFIQSPICRESCQSIRQDESCSFVNQLYSVYQEIKKVCSVPYRENIEEIFKCTRLPTSNIKYIEKCQRQPERDVRKTYSCVVGDGQSFSGYKSNIQCERWNLNPYLDNSTYPSLLSFYCRNPQGYGRKPWCYSDMKTRKISYCQGLPTCTKVTYGLNSQTEEFVEGAKTTRITYSTLYTPPFMTSRETSTHKKTHEESTTVTFTASVGGIVMMVVVILVGIACFTLACSYSSKKRGSIKEYRGIHQRPDINYIKVDG